jgi:hypothetical protein
MWHVWRTGDVHTGFWWKRLRKRNYLEDLNVCGSIILKWIIKKYGGRTWTGFIWLRIATSGRLL